MDVIQRAYRQFFDLYRTMTAAQRLSLVAVPLAMLVGFGFLLSSRPGEQMAAISWGKVFSTEEVIAAEQALIQAGLNDFRREGQRIMAPAGEIDRYNAALLEFDAIPADLGSQMLKQLENTGPFTTDKQRSEIREAMLHQEIRRTFKAIPDLHDVRVVIANSQRRSSWSQKTRVTASVTVWPKPGRDVSARLASSMRAAVASMVPDLQPNDVTVFDVVHGVTHTGEPTDDPFDSRLVQRTKELTRQFEQKIQQGLNYIPDVGVSVNVDIENLKSSVTRSQNIDKQKIAALVTTERTSKDVQQQRPPKGEPGQVANRPGSVAPQQGTERTRQLDESDTQTLNGLSFEVTEKQLIAAMPKAVQVSVSIPRDYYRLVSENRASKGEKDQTRLDVATIEQDVQTAVQKSVSKLIPSGSPPDAITVISVDRLPELAPQLNLPITEQIQQLLKQYGGSAMLAVLIIWSLLMLRRTAPSVAPMLATANAAAPSESPEERLKKAVAGAIAETEKPKEITKRDLLQTVVKDNPEQSAVVISKWVQAAM